VQWNYRGSCFLQCRWWRQYMPVKHLYIYITVLDTSVYLYQTAWHIPTHIRVYDTSLPLHRSEWDICTCVSDCMTSKNTALFILTVMEVSNFTKVHFGKTVKSGVYTGCPRRNGQNFGRVFLMLNYTDITQNTYIQSWTVTEIMAIEKCGLLGCPRTVRRPWRHTHPVRMPGNQTPLASIVM